MSNTKNNTKNTEGQRFNVFFRKYQFQTALENAISDFGGLCSAEGAMQKGHIKMNEQLLIDSDPDFQCPISVP